jgi:hypothetical protein
MKKYYFINYPRLISVRVIDGAEIGFRIPRKLKKQLKKVIELGNEIHGL